jgi:cohesin complex subunit SA-1/2
MSAFKPTFTSFLASLILSLAKSDIFFRNEALVENIRAWVSTMSSATNRPLRHTATVAALAFETGLAEYGRELAEMNAQQLRQTEGEKKRGKNANKARVSEMESQVKENAKKEQIVKNELNDWFNAVFIHRYRDVDHHIRLECMQALGDYVMIYPDLFFDGTFIRYFGWLMSDLNAQTRLETLKSLMRIYKDDEKQHGMRAFTERFRERIVEMATRDSDAGVRGAAIDLLDVIRSAGFLEPDDIDSVGRLIFDSEPRVRKAVVKFFIDNVNDNYEFKLETLGGQEALDELFKKSDDVNENYDAPRIEWLRLKCLIETLSAYDAADELEADEVLAVPDTNAYMFVPGLQSRFALASEELCEKMNDLQWEILAGYILYDHSGRPTQNGTSRRKSSSSQLMTQFKDEVKLSEKEEVLFLEVLNSAVKLSFRQSQEKLNDKSKKWTKSERLMEQEEFDNKARRLTNGIPKLLNKFGALPEAASAILRLEHDLSPENQDASAYSALLGDIKKQFQTHVKPRVLEEASLALLHARAGDAEEMAQNHLHSLAEDSARKLGILAKGQDLSVRGDLDDEALDVLEGAAIRLEMLGRIEDICDLLETPPSEPRKKVSTLPAPVDILLTILNRGLADESEAGGREDQVVLHGARALGFYFMWKIRTLQHQIKASGTVSSTTITSLSSRKDDFVTVLTSIIQQRSGADDLRVFLAGALIDLHVGFASLVRIKPPPKRTGDGTNDVTTGDRAYMSLVSEIPKSTQSMFLQILSACERAFAKRTKRSLERNPEEQKQQDDAEPATDDEPEEDEEPTDDEDDDAMDVDDEGGADAKLAATLLAEQRLCEFAGKLVLGIWAAVVDGESEIGGSKMVRRRLKRNRARLGANFKGVIDALEKGGAVGKTQARKKTLATGPGKPAATASKASAAKKSSLSDPVVIESDEEEDMEE